MNENILLIDVDSLIPNAALMQISGSHKEQNDNVSLNIPNDPKKVYISSIFKENRESALGRAKLYPDAEVYIGGSGVNYGWLPQKVQKRYPDYSLYDGKVCQKCAHKIDRCKCRGPPTPGDMFYSLGFTTRGCIRRCGYCIVHEKEGKIQRWQHIREFHDERFDTVLLLDNNILADKEFFFDNTDYLIEHDLKVDITQGLDIRLLDQKCAERLLELKWTKNIHFAFDNIKDEKAVRTGITLLDSVGIDLRHNVQFYVLVGYNTKPIEDLYRVKLLKKLGANPFIMQYTKTNFTCKLAHYCNRKWIFWSCEFEDFFPDYRKYI